MDQKVTTRIESLQALRALSFISIFITHAYALQAYTVLSLAMFFVLSGFLLAVKDNDFGENEVSFKNSFKYALNKIKKLYPLHFVTMLIDIVLYILVFHYNGMTIRQLIKFIFQIIMNTFLIQSWVPIGDTMVSLNGVSWYLSVLLFLYILFPLIDKVLRNKNNKQKIIILITVPIIEFIVLNIYAYIFGKSSESFAWFAYRNAFIRIPDIIMGYCVGKLYIDNYFKDISTNLATIIEIALTAANIFIFKYYSLISFPLRKLIAGDRAIYYVIISSMWVYMFAINKGLITKLLRNKLLIWIGDLSSFAFLIHYPVIQYTNFFFSIIPYQFSIKTKNIIMILDFFITILLSYLWRNLILTIKKHKHE